MQVKGQGFFSYSRITINTVERMLEKENRSSQNITVMIVVDQKNHQ